MHTSLQMQLRPMQMLISPEMVNLTLNPLAGITIHVNVPILCAYTQFSNVTSFSLFVHADLSDRQEHHKGEALGPCCFSIHSNWNAVCMINACLRNEWTGEVSVLGPLVVEVEDIGSYMNDGDSIIFCAHSMALTEQNGWGSHLLIPSPPVEVSAEGNRDAGFFTRLCLPRVRKDLVY